MKQNMGSTDKMIRVLAAAVVAVLYFTGVISGTVAIILLALGGIFLLTSALGFCPLYTLFGINTNKKKA